MWAGEGDLVRCTFEDNVLTQRRGRKSNGAPAKDLFLSPVFRFFKKTTARPSGESSANWNGVFSRSAGEYFRV